MAWRASLAWRVQLLPALEASSWPRTRYASIRSTSSCACKPTRGRTTPSAWHSEWAPPPACVGPQAQTHRLLQAVAASEAMLALRVAAASRRPWSRHHRRRGTEQGSTRSGPPRHYPHHHRLGRERCHRRRPSAPLRLLVRSSGDASCSSTRLIARSAAAVRRRAAGDPSRIAEDMRLRWSPALDRVAGLHGARASAASRNRHFGAPSHCAVAALRRPWRRAICLVAGRGVLPRGSRGHATRPHERSRVNRSVSNIQTHALDAETNT